MNRSVLIFSLLSLVSVASSAAFRVEVTNEVKCDQLLAPNEPLKNVDFDLVLGRSPNADLEFIKVLKTLPADKEAVPLHQYTGVVGRPFVFSKLLGLTVAG